MPSLKSICLTPSILWYGAMVVFVVHSLPQDCSEPQPPVEGNVACPGAWPVAAVQGCSVVIALHTTTHTPLYRSLLLYTHTYT